jgi:glucarate dehydratase
VNEETNVKIVQVKATAVTIPLKKPVRWSYGIEVSTTRVIVELITDEGIVGIGETRGGDEVVQSIELNKDLFIGVDPLEVNRIARRFGVFRITSEQLSLVGAAKLAGAGIEMACWDIVGKALGKRCGDLWGGVDREEVEFAAYVFYRYNSLLDPGTGNLPENAVEHAVELFDAGGFRDIKFKNGVLTPEEEIKSVRLIRTELGDRLRYLRLDPNAVWSVETSTRILNEIEDFGIEFCEDPTWGIHGMSLVHERTRVPLATNMCCVSFEQIPLVVSTRALDIILGDMHFWGGPTALLQLAKICESFNIGMSLHSDRELGISTAAILQLASAESMVSHTIDTHLMEQVDDVITEPFKFVNGKLSVPKGPGLGVELDRDKLRFYADYHQKNGEKIEFKDPTIGQTMAKIPKY